MKPFTLIFAALVLFAFTACSNKQKEEEQKATAAQDAAKSVDEAMKQLSEGQTVEPVDFQKLKELVPEKLAGLPRRDIQGEKAGAMGFTISQVQAEFGTDDGEKELEVSITDPGSLTGMMGMTYAAWLSAEVERESADGYEKTTTFNGYKAYERYNKPDKNGELNIIVGNRFIVRLEGSDMNMDDIRKAANSLDLGKLERLK